MDMTALIPFVCREEGLYFRLANEVVKERYDALMEALGLPRDDTSSNARYYTLVNVLALAQERHGEAFARWLVESRTEVEFLSELAERKGVVFMYGPGFSAPEGTVRISLANLDRDAYIEIARRLFELLDEYAEEFEEETGMEDVKAA